MDWFFLFKPLLFFCFLFPCACRSLASWWQVCTPWTPSWPFGSGAWPPAARARLRAGTTSGRARRPGERWRQGLSWRKTIPYTDQWTNEEPPLGRTLPSGQAFPQFCHFFIQVSLDRLMAFLRPGCASSPAQTPKTPKSTVNKHYIEAKHQAQSGVNLERPAPRTSPLQQQRRATPDVLRTFSCLTVNDAE